MWMGLAKATLQLLRSKTGISSRPEAAFGFTSSIALIMSSSEKFSISSVKGCAMLGGANVADSMFVFEGSLNTEENWF